MNKQIFEKHFKEEYPKIIKRLSFRAGTPEAAEDIVQEAYCRALKYFNSYDGRDFNAWFARIVFRCLVEYKNAEKGYSTDDPENQEEEAAPCTLEYKTVMSEIYDLISTKSDVQIEVLTYYFQYEYSAMDISKITPYSYAQAHKIISRFREELRQLYKR